MKDFISPLAILLVAASVNASSAAAKKNSKNDDIAREMLTNIYFSSLESPPSKNNLGEGDWTSILSCTADMSDPQAPSLIDETTCSQTTDSNGEACVWCDATASLGSGLCISPDVMSIASSMCAESTDGNTPDDNTPPPPVPVPVPVPATPSPTNKPTSAPVEPTPVDPPAPSPFECMQDATSNVISDEATCESTTDASGASCEWCDIYIVGGSCMTSSMKQSMSLFCRGQDQDSNNNLRGGKEDVFGWKSLDPSCLGDSNGLSGDKDGCAARTDVNGDSCIWCEAGNDVFGICTTVSQKDYVGGYMSCGEAKKMEEEEEKDAASSAVAVE